MFRDLGRVHIASFAVGIVGLVVGIVGIVLAIVFGTASCNCPTATAAPVTCPPTVASACNTNLFSIQTGVSYLDWNPDYNDTTKDTTKAAIANITTTLKASLNAGMNTPSASSLMRILAATGPTFNNAQVEILRLEQGFDVNGKSITTAYGNGAVSSANPDFNAIPDSNTVKQIINSQNSTYVPDSTQTSPSVCQFTNTTTTTEAPMTCPPVTSPTDCPSAAPCNCPTLSPTTCPTAPPCNCPTTTPTTCPSVTATPCPTVVPTSCPTVPAVTCPPPTQCTCPTVVPVVCPSSSAPISSTPGGATSPQTTTQPTVSSTQMSSGTAPTSTVQTQTTTATGQYSTASSQSTPTAPTSPSIITSTQGIPITSTSNSGTTSTSQSSPTPQNLPSTSQTPITTSTQGSITTSTQGVTSGSPSTPQASTSQTPVITSTSQIISSSTQTNSPITSTPGAPNTSQTPITSTQSSTSTSPQATTHGPSTPQSPPSSTQLVPSSTPGTPSTSQSPTPTSGAPTQGSSTPSPSTITTTDSGVPSTTMTTPGGSSPNPTSSAAPITSPTTPASITTTAQGTSTTQGPSSSASPSTPSSSTSPISTSPSSVPTIAPGQCYYQSNVAVAFELTYPDADVEMKMENFIQNTLFFYPGNPYQLGGPGEDKTRLALVPYPTDEQWASLMNYGHASGKAGIGVVLNAFAGSAKSNADIVQALDFIVNNQPQNGTRPGSSVIIIGNNGTAVSQAVFSSGILQGLGINVITVGYTSSDDFSPLASTSAWSFKIGSDADELTVAQQIGTILNMTFCAPGSTVSPLPTSPATPTSSIASGTSTTIQPVSSSAATSSAAPTSSFAPGTSTTIQQVSSSAATSSVAPASSTTVAATSSSMTPVTFTTAPASSSSTAPSSSPAPGTSSTASIPSSSIAPGSSTSVPISSSSATPISTTPVPTLPPNTPYYQSNVAVIFELTNATGDIDLEIENFIVNELFFYNGAPYELGGINDGKTALSMIPVPAGSLLSSSMAYGFAKSPQEINATWDIFSIFAAEPANISSAFEILPTVNRNGPPGFVILVANDATSVADAVPSATALKNQGFQIVTVAFKSAGAFDSLASQSSYNFNIHQDADQSTVAQQIGNLLNSTFWSSQGSTSVGPTGSTLTPPVASSSGAPSSTVTVPSTVTMPGSSSTSFQSTSPQGSSTATPVYTSTVTAPGSSSTSGGSSTTPQSGPSSTVTAPGSSSSPSVQTSTTSSGSSTATPQGSSTVQPGTSSISPQTSTSPVGSSTVPGSSTTVTVPSTSQPGSSSTSGPSTLGSSTTSGPSTSQICPNQQVVFNGQLGIIFELLPPSSSTQQATINAFVENILLNSNSYGLAVDNVSGENRTLVTAIPYPSTNSPQYNVQGYGSARSQDQFKSQVETMYALVRPVTDQSDISDALTYVLSNLTAGDVPSALIIVGNSGAMIDVAAPIIAAQLQETFSIFTVAVGDTPTDLSPLSSGDGYSFTGNSQTVADQIAQKLQASNPSVYCPPPAPSTSAPITSTAAQTSTVPITTTVVSTRTVTTQRPTVGPCECTGRWVYNGDLAIAFEFVNGSPDSQRVVNFVQNILLENADSYGLSNDVNGNQPSKLDLLPYPKTNKYPDFGYGSIKTPAGVRDFIDAYSGIQTTDTDPSIDDAFSYITNHPGDSDFRAVLLVAADGSDVQAAQANADKLKAAGFLVITVAQTSSADVFRPLASGDQYALHIGDGNDNAVAAQIAYLLIDQSFTCYDDGSSTPAPTTRCPGQTLPTLPVVTVTQAPSTAAPTSTPSISSTAPVSSSTAANTGSSSTVTAPGSSTTQAPGSSSVAPGSSTTVGSSTTSSSGSTSTAPGSSTPSNTGSTSQASTASTTQGTTVNDGSSTTSQAPTGPTTPGSSTSPYTGTTVTDNGSSSTTAPGSSTPAGSTATVSSTIANTGSTTTNFGSSTTALYSTTLPIPTCESPYKGIISVLFELTSPQSGVPSVVSFVRDNLYNSNNYNFGTDTFAINVPYGNTDNYGDSILQFKEAQSLLDLQANLYTLSDSVIASVDPTISDGLIWLHNNRDPSSVDDVTNRVVIIVGNRADDNSGLTSTWLQTLRNDQQYKILSVGAGTGHADFSSLADSSDWYFQVDDSNGQYVADQISSVLCHLSTQPSSAGTSATTANTGMSSTVTATGSSTTQAPGSTSVAPGSSTPGSTGTDGSSTISSSGSTSTAPGSSTPVNTGSTSQAPTGSTTPGSSTSPYTGTTATDGSSTTSSSGSTSIAPGSSTPSSSGSTSQAPTGSTTPGSSTSPYTGTTATDGSSTTSSSGSTSIAPGSSTPSSSGSTSQAPTGSTTPGSSTSPYTGTTATDGSSTTSSSGSTSIAPGSSTPSSSGSTSQAPTGSTTPGSSTSPYTGSTVTDNGSSSTTAPGSSTPAGSTATASSTIANTGSTTTNFGSSTTALYSTTLPIPACESTYKGIISVVFELTSPQSDAPSVVSFVRDNLFNSTNYNFGTDTFAINVPYGNTDSYEDSILDFEDAKSLVDLQTNMDTLSGQVISSIDPTISDGLEWLFGSRDPSDVDNVTNRVIIIVGNRADYNPGGTTTWLRSLRNGQQYKVLSVGAGTGHADFSSLADSSDWYFQVDDSNGQYVADQISSILCHL